MKSHLIILTMTMIAFTACSNTKQVSPKSNKIVLQKVPYERPTQAKSDAFNSTMKKVASSIQHDSRYSKMALTTTEKKAWFKNLMYRLWDRQITRTQFVREGLKLYPTHAYEFNFVANGFQKYS